MTLLHATLLAAGGLGTLVVLLVFVVLSSVNRWLQKQRDADMGDWDAPRPGTPPTQPRRTSETESWEEELRRLLRPPTPPALPQRPKPAPAPQAEEGPAFEMPAPAESRTAMEEAERLPRAVTARLQRVSSHLGDMEQSREAMETAYALEPRTQAHLLTGIAGSLNRARAPHEQVHPAVTALLRQLRQPEGARQAVLASLVLSPPKGLET